jgi:hypothetical protein
VPVSENLGRCTGLACGLFFLFDLQIPRSSLIITGLFADFFAIVQSGDAARFRCKGSCSSFNFSGDRPAIVH